MTNNGAPGVGQITVYWTDRECGAFRLVDVLACELGEGRYRPWPAPGVLIRKPGLNEDRWLAFCAGCGRTARWLALPPDIITSPALDPAGRLHSCLRAQGLS